MRSEEGATKDPLKELKDQFNTKRLTLNVHENTSKCQLEKMKETNQGLQVEGHPENIQREQKALKGEAREVVREILVSKRNVQRLMEVLEQRFGKARYHSGCSISRSGNLSTNKQLQSPFLWQN
jgi:hypothetical protein